MEAREISTIAATWPEIRKPKGKGFVRIGNTEEGRKEVKGGLVSDESPFASRHILGYEGMGGPKRSKEKTTREGEEGGRWGPMIVKDIWGSFMGGRQLRRKVNLSPDTAPEENSSLHHEGKYQWCGTNDSAKVWRGDEVGGSNVSVVKRSGSEPVQPGEKQGRMALVSLKNS